jgi:hypothetical protein
MSISNETWSAKTSTLLQVFVSIQSLIFVQEPYWNEPGYERSMHTPAGRLASQNYNDVIRVATARWAILDQLLHPSAGFEQVIERHFELHAAAIMAEIDSWIDESSSRPYVCSQLQALRAQLDQAFVGKFGDQYSSESGGGAAAAASSSSGGGEDESSSAPVVMVAFDDNNNSGVTVSNDGKTACARLDSPACWRTVMSREPLAVSMDASTNRWRVHIGKTVQSTMLIGVVAVPIGETPKTPRYVGTDKSSWALMGISGTCWHRAARRCYSIGAEACFAADDHIELELNASSTRRHTKLSFAINETSLSVAYANLPLPSTHRFHLAVSLFHCGDSISIV